MTLEAMGAPYAQKYFGTGRFTGRLTDAEEANRDPMHFEYVGDLTEDEFYAEVERQIALEFGDR